MDSFSLFVYLIFPPMVLVLGVMGNLMGIVFILKNKKSKFNLKSIYMYLFVFDTLYILQSIFTFMQYTLEKDLQRESIYFCKIFNFFNYSLAVVSPMLIILISLERLVSIMFIHKKNILNTHAFQVAYLTCVLIFNFLFYLGIPITMDLVAQTSNDTQVVYCTFKDDTSLLVNSYLDLANRVVLQTILMLGITFALSYMIYKSRKKVYLTGAAQSKKYRKDMKFTITFIFLNLIYIALNLPVSITIFYNFQSNTGYVFTYFIFYFSYGCNFYIILAFNSLIRSEFFIMIGLKSRRNPISTSLNTVK